MKTDIPPSRGGVIRAAKRFFIGGPKPTAHLVHERLGKVTALAIFASDNLSSSAYATEEILRVAIVVGALAFTLVVPLTLALLGVLAVLIFSYRQTIRAYPQAGGAYLVTKDNFGLLPAQVAGVALLTDYVLTVSVSVAAGTAALASAVPGVFPWRVPVSVAFIGLIAWGNLRGVKESGRIFAAPTYFFIVMMFVLIAMGLEQLVTGHLSPARTFDLPKEAQSVTWFLVLHAFASGGAAVTGVEAISNGVPAFRPPEWRNARTTLVWMGSLLGAMFLGLSILARHLHIVPDPEETVTVNSQIARAVFGSSSAGDALFSMLQVATLLILVLAANTSYADFPRLASFHAGDRFLPRQLTRYGDRLVFSNGIIVLSIFAALLVIVFRASVTRLIPLYAIGVFTSFTFSQAGMARRHIRLREPGWRRGLLINGVGAAVSAVMTIVIAITKFIDGAWLILIAIPVILTVLLRINHHYKEVGRQLRHPDRRPSPASSHHVVLLVGRPNATERRAFAYASLMNATDFECVHFLEHGEPKFLEAQWARQIGIGLSAPSFKTISVGRGGLMRSLSAYARTIRDGMGSHDFVTFVVSESIRPGSLRKRFGNPKAFLIKMALLFAPGIVVTDVPTIEGAPDVLVPGRSLRHEVVVLVSGVHNATQRAVEYARALRADATQAVHVSVDEKETEIIIRDWREWEPGLPLEVLDSPYREIGQPLLEYLHELRSNQDKVVTVVLPEFLPAKLWHHALHNQTALTLKRLFLTEPGIVLTSVPYRLEGKGRGRVAVEAFARRAGIARS
jgi:amino acid transporter